MAAEPRIREATEADVEALADLLIEIQDVHAASVPQIYRPAEAADELVPFLRGQIGQERSRMFVAEDEGGIVGYVYVRVGEPASLPVFTPRRYAEIDTIVVGKRAQRQGIGRALMERAQQWGIEQGADQAQLSVLDFNRGAIEFYEELGYVPLRHMMWRKLG